jgi:transposase
MRRPRRNHSSEFKAKVALAAIQGDLTMSELVKKFDVHANQITEWKKKLQGGALDVFGKGAQKAEDSEQTVSELHAKIGQLTRACPMSGASALGMENDFLERGLTRIHGPRGKKW